MAGGAGIAELSWLASRERVGYRWVVHRADGVDDAKVRGISEVGSSSSGSTGGRRGKPEPWVEQRMVDAGIRFSATAGSLLSAEAQSAGAMCVAGLPSGHLPAAA